MKRKVDVRPERMPKARRMAHVSVLTIVSAMSFLLPCP